MKRLFIFLSFLLVSVGMSFAQTTRVTGTITSSEDGQPVVGASIVVKGTTTGTITDLDGKFAFEVPSSAKTLMVSYIGMKVKEVAIQRNMSIVLDPDMQSIDEVVVTAMGLTREKKSLGYAIQEVKSDELTKAGQMNLTSSLTGKVAGVQVNQFGGSVGASSRISIRGNGSLQADQQPLIVVDGVPVANDSNRSGDNTYNGVDYGSGLNDINPEDIETITVLKGGSAALYGMRAGNGVILITTKSGKTGKGVKISYDGSLTLDRISTIPHLQDSYGQGSQGSEYDYARYAESGQSYQDYAAQNSFWYVDGKGGGVNDGYDESWGPRLNAGLKLAQFDSPVDASGNRTATDWITPKHGTEEFFQTGVTMNHTVSLAAESEKSMTRASLSYRSQTGTVPNTDQERYSGQINTTMSISKQVSFDLSANYTRTESDNLVAQGYATNNPINGLFLWHGRQVDMKSLKDNWDQRDAMGNYTYYNWNSNYHMNPYFTVNENTNSYQRDRIFAKSSLYYQPFEYLKFEGRFGIDYYNAQTFERHYYDFDYPSGAFRQEATKNTELNADFLASFHKTFGDFNISAMAGANYRDLNWKFDRFGATALTVLGIYTIANKSGDAETYMDHSHIRSNSVYANGSVGWKSQLYVDVSARNDWSSTIKDSFFYPSISASWIPTETFSFLKESPLSFLKLRAGIAKIGNATSAYRNRAYYYSESNAFNGVAQMYKSFTYPNENLKPEKITTWEIGVEAGVLDDRIHADVAYYHKTTKDQILYVSTSNTSGFSSMLINAGEMQNKGIEIQLRGDVLRSKEGLNWTSTFNFSKDNSKVVSLYKNPADPTQDLKTYQIGWTWGIATQAKVGDSWGDLVSTGYNRVSEDDVKAGTADASQIGSIKVNSRGLQRTKASQTIGNVTPDFLAGWRNEFNYKNFNFGFLLDLRIGGDIWSQSMSHGYAAGTASYTVDGGIRERAIVAGKDVFKDEKFVMLDANNKYVTNTIETDAQTLFESGGCAETYVFDGSFLKLREAFITYTFPKYMLAKTKYISKATLSLIGSNLALLWVHDSNTMRLDPEAGGVSSDSRGVGFEQASIPASRSFGLKLGLTF